MKYFLFFLFLENRIWRFMEISWQFAWNLFSGKKIRKISAIRHLLNYSGEVVKVKVHNLKRKRKACLTKNDILRWKSMSSQILMQTLLSKLCLNSPRPMPGSQRQTCAVGICAQQKFRSDCAQSSETSLGAFWIAKNAKFLRADNEDRRI